MFLAEIVIRRNFFLHTGHWLHISNFLLELLAARFLLKTFCGTPVVAKVAFYQPSYPFKLFFLLGASFFMQIFSVYSVDTVFGK
jgi:hypothetical protein